MHQSDRSSRAERRPRRDPAGEALANLRRLAEAQHSVVAVRQAAALGVSPAQLRHLLATGRWERWSLKVVRLSGAPRTFGTDLMASVLDAGTGAAVGGRSAAWLWRLPEHPPGPVDLVVPRGSPARSNDRYRVARPTHMAPDLVTAVSGIPVLRLAPVLFQLAAGAHPDKMFRLLSNVGRRSPGTIRECQRLLAVLATSGRPGIVTMRSALEEFPSDGPWLASNLERRFEWVLSRYGEPPLTRQVDVGGHDWLGRVDFADLELGALFEVQSEAHHSNPADLARDERRRLSMLAAGWRAFEVIEEDWVWHDGRRAAAVVHDTRARLRAAAG